MKECLQAAWDNGINTFDTAEVRPLLDYPSDLQMAARPVSLINTARVMQVANVRSKWALH